MGAADPVEEDAGEFGNKLIHSLEKEYRRITGGLNKKLDYISNDLKKATNIQKIGASKFDNLGDASLEEL